MTFKSAVIISIFIHAIIILPLYDAALIKPHAEPLKPVVIDYIVIKDYEKVRAIDKRPEVKTLETPRIELKDDVETMPTKRQAKIKSSRDYVNYYQLIREKIRQRLKANYKDYYKEGDVSVIFVLNRDGSLMSLDVEQAHSAIDKILIDIAVRSVKEASPFPAFPKALALPKMPFNLTISFKKR